jgi:hypothetical protein
MSTDSPRRVKCDRCSRVFAVSAGAAASGSLPVHDDEEHRPCSGGRAVELASPIGAGDHVEAWLPPPAHLRGASDGGDAKNRESSSRRHATVLSSDGAKLRVRDEGGDEYDVEAADLGEAQPAWVDAK